MSELKRILTVVDPTAEAQPALERAADLADRAGASLELFLCDYDQYLAGERFFDERSLEQARQALLSGHQRRLHALAERTGANRQIDISQHVAWDHPLHEGIVRRAVAFDASLVVKDTHYHPAYKRSLFSNTDWSLIRSCPCELLLVKPRPLSAKPIVIAAVDPLHEHDKPATLDDRILGAAKRYCAMLDGELHVCHAYDPAPALAISADSATMPLAVPARELMESLKTAHTNAVHKLLASHDVPRDRVHIHQGPAHEVLIDLADELNADLVVTGAVSRSGLKRLFLGSTAEQLLDRLPTDLLIIKPANLGVQD